MVIGHDLAHRLILEGRYLAIGASLKVFWAKNIPYETIDFKEQKKECATFYREKRPFIYRNPEGVEFPFFYDGEVVKLGSGEIIAYLLSSHVLEGSVTRSDLLHGWLSGLYPSLCPEGQEDNYLELVRHLADGLVVHPAVCNAISPSHLSIERSKRAP